MKQNTFYIIWLYLSSKSVHKLLRWNYRYVSTLFHYVLVLTCFLLAVLYMNVSTFCFCMHKRNCDHHLCTSICMWNISIHILSNYGICSFWFLKVCNKSRFDLKAIKSQSYVIIKQTYIDAVTVRIQTDS